MSASNILASILSFLTAIGLYSGTGNTNSNLVDTSPSTVSSPGAVLAETTDSITTPTFTLNIPANFTKDITAPNILYSLTSGTGISISSGQTPIITNTGVLSLNSLTGALNLTVGDGISLDGLKITNTGILSLEAGDNISIDGNKITNTYSAPDIDYTLGGWTDNGTSIVLTTTTDSVTVDTFTAGAITADSLTTSGLALAGGLTVTSGNSLLPDTDLGSDIGSASYRFNNLWVANINSNSSQAFSGQTTFSYAPTDTTISQSSVLINPTTSAANGQLLGLAIGGYQKALIDEDGDIILGYSDSTSAPATDNPFMIYGHSASNVLSVDTTGYLGFSISDPEYPIDLRNLGASGHIFMDGGRITFAGGEYIEGTGNNLTLDAQGKVLIKDSGTEVLRIEANSIRLATDNAVALGSSTLRLASVWANDFNTSGGLTGIGTIAPTSKLHVSGAVTGKALAIFDETGNQALLTASASGVTKFTVLNDGKVGIGTATPGYSLEVNTGDSSSYALRLNDNTTLGRRWGGNTLYQMSSIGGDSGYGTLNFNNASTSIDFIAHAIKPIFSFTVGRVGIGTTAPTSLLHVSGAVTGKALAIFDETGNQAIFTASASGAPKFVIDNSGNVGIGTTSPTKKLQVESGTFYVKNSQVYGIEINHYQILGGAGVTLVYGNTTLGVDATGITSNAHGSSKHVFKDNQYLGSSTDVAYAFQTSQDPANYSTYVDRFNILGNGNIGLGTASPTSKLHVSGAVTGKALAIFDETGDQALLTASASGITKLVLTNTGNLGVGYSSPVSRLHVTPASAAGNSISYVSDINGVGTYRGITFGFYASEGAAFATTSIDGTPGSRLFRYNSAGATFLLGVADEVTISSNILSTNSTTKTGLGTASPTSKLHVTGAVTGKALAIFDETGNQDILVASASGATKVRIGSTGIIYTDSAIKRMSAGSMTFLSNTDQSFAYLAHDAANFVSNSFSMGNYTNYYRFTSNSNNVHDLGATALRWKNFYLAGNADIGSLTTGTVYSNAGVLTNTDPSDATLKQNILNLPDGTLDKVLGLKPVSYEWISTGDGALGFLAQDVQQIFPELVGTNQDGTLGLYTTQFIPVLAKAIQEQQLQIDGLSNASGSAQTTTQPETSSLLQTLITNLQNSFNNLSQQVTSLIGRFEEIFATRSHQEVLCIGTQENETCVTQDQLNELIKLLPTPTLTPTPTSESTPTPTPESSPTPTPESSPSATPTPTI